MHLIALTGGIASGKSTVAARLADHGAVVIDADVLAREVVEPGTPGLAAIAERFGAGVLASDGSLDRRALGAIVFADEQARLALNAITHPAVRQLSVERFTQALDEDPNAIVVYDVPLLAEGRASGPLDFDLVVVVHAGSEERVRRLVELRGLSHDEAKRRIASQASDEERLALAGVVIDANGTLADTLEQTDALWRNLRAS